MDNILEKIDNEIAEREVDLLNLLLDYQVEQSEDLDTMIDRFLNLHRIDNSTDFRPMENYQYIRGQIDALINAQEIVSESK